MTRLKFQIIQKNNKKTYYKLINNQSLLGVNMRIRKNEIIESNNKNSVLWDNLLTLLLNN